jgi:hypothetical protein
METPVPRKRSPGSKERCLSAMKNTLRVPALQAKPDRRIATLAAAASGEEQHRHADPQECARREAIGMQHRELPERQADFLHPHHRDAPVRCPVCDKRVQRQARQQTYCSRKCRQRAHYDKSVAEGRFNPLSGKDTGLPTNPPQKSCNFSELRATKPGSSLRIYGPARVIERELFAGRDWRVVTSADGVICHVAGGSR